MINDIIIIVFSSAGISNSWRILFLETVTHLIQFGGHQQHPDT